METPLGNITSTALTAPVTHSTLVINSTFKTLLKPNVTAKTGSAMSKDAKSCSLEECAKEHLVIVTVVLVINLLLLIISTLIICNCKQRNSNNKSSRQDIEAIKVTTLERTTADQSSEQSPTIGPVTAPPRKPLPPPPTSFRQRADTEHPAYLEIISDNSSGFQERSHAGNSPETERTPGSRRALIPPSRYRQPITQPSSSMANTTDDYEISSYLEPREGLGIQGTGPYAELNFQRTESRANSTTKTKGYLGLNSLTRIRAKMKRNRTDN